MMDKLAVSLRYWLLGKGMHQALDAMEFASKYHIGKRKDGAPEFSHQLSIVSFLRTLDSGLMFPEQTYVAGFLHDTPEDYDVSFVEIETKFGKETTEAIQLLTKTYRGVKLNTKDYYTALAENPISSIVKGADRIHNIQSMIGAFTIKKQEEYIQETNEYVLPMLKKARRNFSKQEACFENEKLILKNQIQLLEESHKFANQKEI